MLRKALLVALLCLPACAQKVASTNAVGPNGALIGRNGSTNWLYVPTDSSGRLFTDGTGFSGTPQVASTDLVGPLGSLIGYYAAGSEWLYLPVDANGNLYVNCATGCSGTGGDTITSPGSTLSVGGSSTATTLDLNLAHANTWTAPITNSAAGAASTPGVSISGAPYSGGNGTTNFPQFFMGGGTAVTTWSTAGTEIGVNSPSGFSGNLIDLRANGGGAQFQVSASGTTYVNGQLTVGNNLPIFASFFQPNTLYSAAGTAIPACNSGLKGRQAAVSDALAPTYLGTYTSNASGVTSPVVCNGTNWVTY